MAHAYVKGRVAAGRALPAVVVRTGEDKVLGCITYALGVEGGGGWHEGEGPPPQGMVPELFAELRKMLGPKWDGGAQHV